MKTFILVGGIGSGKSTVSQLLADHGANCIDLDDVGHEVLLQPEAIALLVETFGEDILAENGEIDRAALAAKAFATPAETIKLNAITHPRLAAIATERLKQNAAAGVGVSIVEISAFDGPTGTFAPFVRDAQGIIAVVAPKKMRIERAVAKGFAEEDVKNRIARQVDDVQRQLWADYVVNNKGDLDSLSASVDDLWAKLNGSPE